MRPRIVITWDGDEAIIRTTRAFDSCDWITQMDCLSDAIAYLSDLYNSKCNRPLGGKPCLEITTRE